MTGEEWLVHVFAPALQRGTPRVMLYAQLRALRECDVLDAAQLADAERRLEASRPVVRPPTTVAPAPTNRLLRVLAPALPLADIDGVTYVLTSVELWEHSVDVFVAALPSAETARREGEALDAMERWAHVRRAGIGRGGPPPDPTGTARLGILIDISDDLGTPYRMRQASAGGTGTEWRLHKTCTPGVPTQATSLILRVADDDGRPVLSCPVALGQ